MSVRGISWIVSLWLRLTVGLCLCCEAPVSSFKIPDPKFSACLVSKSAIHNPLEITLIGPASSWTSVGLKELWDYRELLYFLTWRDVKVRYKQTALGAVWAVIQPFSIMVVFSLFFGRLAGIQSDGIPYPIFTFCALLPWQLFAHALIESSGLSPMAGVVEGFRWALLGKQQPPGALLTVSIAVVIAFLIGGLYYFRRMEQEFADVV